MNIDTIGQQKLLLQEVGLADYFLLNDSNEDDVYQLRFESINRNPTRVIIPTNNEIYSVIKKFYINKTKIEK